MDRIRRLWKGGRPELLTIKSSGEVLEFWVDADAPYGQFWKEFEQKMRGMRNFYKGASSPAHFFGKKFTEMQKKEIRSLLQKEIGLETVSFSDDEDIVRRVQPTLPPEPPELAESAAADGEGAPGDLFFRGTLRSGQRLENEGNIVVVGDVNAGAELVAGGNIVVFGKLRGLAHAGAYGGRADAIIAANSLIPQQVRIGGKIAIIPSGRPVEGPEIVRVQDGKILVDFVG